MTTTERPTLPADAEPYVAAVRSLLWALPGDERDELLDDLSAHLAELAAEAGPPLRDRLGPPSQYAAEFVTSAGVESPLSQPALALPRLRSLRLPPVLRERLAALRPAWLVLRPFVLVFGGAELIIGDFSRTIERHELVLLTLAAVAAISLSQRLAGAWDQLASVAAVLCGLALASAWLNGPQVVYVDNTGWQPTGILMRGDGTPVSNIWAYDVDGNPVDVFLFDQSGRPLDDVGFDGYDARTGDQLQTQVRTGVNGAPIPNLYPREQVRYGRFGAEREPAPAVSTPRVEESTTTTSTTAPPPTTAPGGPPSTP